MTWTQEFSYSTITCIHVESLSASTLHLSQSGQTPFSMALDGLKTKKKKFHKLNPIHFRTNEDLEKYG